MFTSKSEEKSTYNYIRTSCGIHLLDSNKNIHGVEINVKLWKGWLFPTATHIKKKIGTGNASKSK